MKIFWWRKTKDDFYITFLKYARQKMVEGEAVGYAEMAEYVSGIHSEVSKDAL